MKVPTPLFDGIHNGYLPPVCLPVSTTVLLHTNVEDNLDPITYEVVRSKLWNLNLEHGEALGRVSGSARTVHANDWQTSIHTESGDSVMFGPAIQYFAGTTDAMIKWTLQHRGDNPGFAEGDVFIQNDPYIGCNHQMDTSLFSPIFWEERLFCWVNSTCHWSDIGGVHGSSFVPQAVDIFWESAPIPPLKIVEGGRLRADIEDVIKRKSRLPELCALELRAQLAGVAVARGRIMEMLSRYGSGVIKGVMRRSLDATERTVKARIATLPDGTWRDVMYMSCVAPGDRKLRKQVMTMVKRGDMLHFSNEGTSEQHGSANCSATTLRASILNAVMATLAWDQKFCAGGVLRCMELSPVPGTMNACTFPAAVTGTSAAVTSLYQALILMSKMIACSSDLSKMVMTPSGLSTVALTIINAKNRSGARFISSITDPGAIGAFSFRDGVDFGGFVFNPRSRMAASVEVWEEHSDMLMLYRKANEGGGGHGRWRGGTSTTYAITRHKAQHLEASNFGLAPSIPTAQGLFGGYLGGGGKYYFAFESGLREALAQGSLPADGTELRITAPNGRRVQAKEVGVEFGRDSIWEITHCTTPGYGDPLRRSPLLVAKDVANHAVTAEVAGNIYGTVLKVDGTLDAEQTRQLRAKLRLERLAKCTMPRSECSMQDQAEMPVVLNVGDTLVVLKGTEHYVFGCAHCAAPIGPVSKNYKDFAATLDLQLTQIEPGRFEDPHSDTEASLVYRQYLCASCGSLLHNDLCQPDDRSVWDMELDVASLGRTDKLPSTPPVSRAARADILS